MPAAPPPARVLKLDRPHAAAPVEEPRRPRGWNLSDFESDCDDRLDAVRERCRALLAEAVAEAEEIRSKAHAEGLETGRTAGLNDAENRIAEAAAAEAERLSRDRLAAALTPLARLADAYRSEQDRWRANWERDAVGLACAIAGRLLGRELKARPDAAADLAAEALAAAAGCRAPAVTMHPDDLAALGGAFRQDVLMALGEGATLTADPALSRGDCFVRGVGGEVDGRLATRLDRIAAELLPDEPADGSGR
ncbi:FliH/SctL family protein [Alienimonas californiensis]|uniref:Flagellar assembly protein FliH n=1 Tax=Alienimonas californiensis TaxID=2527989 RepID=A0A517PE36_9PLAN|nr:FliH/SctL family protein [Alienimonas californiensis]QDT17640.1 flagellar assembly protein H [Alienimonas californiensis]